MLVIEFGGLYYQRMMNESEQTNKPNFWPKEQVGLSVDIIMSLSEQARSLYDSIYDYCTYASDPQYQRLHAYRNQISKLEQRDRDVLIGYFNHDPAIRWNGIPNEPYRYYQDPY